MSGVPKKQASKGLELIRAILNDMGETKRRDLMSELEGDSTKSKDDQSKADSDNSQSHSSDYTIDHKKEAITLYLTNKNYCKTSREMKLRYPSYKWDEKSIANWVKLLPDIAESIRQKLKAEKGLAKKQVRDKISYYPEVDKTVFAYLVRERSLKHAVSRDELLQYALSVSGDSIFKASIGWFYRFCKRNGVVRRARTHTVQQIKADTYKLVLTHLESLRTHRFKAMLNNTSGFSNPVIYCNMDEVAIQLDAGGHTMDFVGKKQVDVVGVGGNKVRFTVVLAVLSDGRFLPPLIIFKSKSPLREELTTKFKDVALIFANSNGWNNIELTKIWLKNVLGNLLIPSGKSLALVWDKFSAHINGEVEGLAKKSADVFVIPPGCTGLLQPLDTHINRPFKCYFRKLFRVWLNT